MWIQRYFKGLSVLWRSGTLLARQPKLIKYMILPVLFSLTTYVVLLAFLYTTLESTFNDFLPSLSGDDVWSIIFYVFWLLVFVLLFLYLASYSFISISKIFAAPFNDLLSERIEVEYNPAYEEPKNAFQHFLNTIFPTILEEIKKVSLITLGFAILFFLSLIPVINVFIAPISVAYSVLALSIDFVDYPLARRLMRLREKKQFVIGNMPELLGFGSGTFVLFLIPFLGLFILPIAVIGGTMLFIDTEKDDENRSCR